jgi:uncharacterized protein (TIGR02147 family)
MRQTELLQIIRNELAVRIQKNPNYSMRAFAKLLQVNIGTLSSILNGKRPLTEKSLAKFCDRLNLAPVKKQKAMQLISKFNKVNKGQKLVNGISIDRNELEQETYSAITEWYHWAILQLVRIDIYGHSEKHKSPKWFATRLGISEVSAKLALDRLVNLELLTIEKGYYKRTKAKLTSANRSVTSTALRQLQKNLRLKAIESLENDPIDIRSMTSMSIACDTSKIQEAKVIIDEFQEKMSRFLETDSKEKVYQLTVSLFPLEKGEPS